MQVHNKVVNLRSVYAATSTGGGLATLRNICIALDFPAPVHPSHYSKYLKYIGKASFDICNESMKATCINLKMLYGVPEIDVIDVPVSIDGTWQKRYGHNSLLGVSFVISMDTGCVLDYSVKSKVCHVCRRNKNAGEEWKEEHKLECVINHSKSAGSMEKDGVVEMYLRSIEKNSSKYGVYVSDGDTNPFGAVIDALKNKYGEDYQVRKEDCIGRVQKGMGNSLRKYKNNRKGTLLADNKSVGGTGSLTDKVVEKIQTYYG